MANIRIPTLATHPEKWTDLSINTLTIPPNEWFTLYDEDSNSFNYLRNYIDDPILLSGDLASGCWVAVGKQDTF